MPSSVGHTAAALIAVLESAIVWGYNLLEHISCSNGLVSNWWTLPPGDAWPWATANGLECHNSATEAGAYGADAVRIPWRVTLDYFWFPDETIAVPLFDDHGRLKGAFGAKHYANRWSSSWRDAIRAPPAVGDPTAPRQVIPPGAYPPLQRGVTRLRPDQVLPVLQSLAVCDSCPMGFTASPWNAFGGYPVISTFMVPLDGLPRSEMQEWLDFLIETAFAGATGKEKYFDTAAQVIVAALLAGDAWLPLPAHSPPPPLPPPTPMRKRRRPPPPQSSPPPVLHSPSVPVHVSPPPTPLLATPPASSAPPPPSAARITLPDPPIPSHRPSPPDKAHPLASPPSPRSSPPPPSHLQHPPLPPALREINSLSARANAIPSAVLTAGAFAVGGGGATLDLGEDGGMVSTGSLATLGAIAVLGIATAVFGIRFCRGRSRSKSGFTRAPAVELPPSLSDGSVVGASMARGSASGGGGGHECRDVERYPNALDLNAVD